MEADTYDPWSKLILFVLMVLFFGSSLRNQYNVISDPHYQVDENPSLFTPSRGLLTIAHMDVAQKTGTKINPDKWKHGPKPAVCPSRLLLSHPY